MPLITNAEFLAEFKKRCKGTRNQTVQTDMIHDVSAIPQGAAATRVNPVDALKVIETLLNTEDGVFAGWRTDARFTCAQGNCTKLTGPEGQKLGTYNVVKDVFADAPRHRLMGFLASLLVPFVAMWVKSRALEAQRVAIANAAAAAVPGGALVPPGPAVNLAVLAAVKELGVANYSAVAQVASRAAAAAGATPAVVQAIFGSGPAARNDVETNGTSKLVASGNAAVNAALLALPAVTAGIQAVARATANAAVTHRDLDLSITPAVVNAYNLLGANIMAKHGINRRAAFFRTNIETLCQRLLNDWDDINSLFFPNLTLKKLVHIQTTGADFHKQGKQVLILTFKAHPVLHTTSGIGCFKKNVIKIQRRQLVKLIYKPSDVELDWRMVGDTVAMQNRLPVVTAAAPFNAHSLFTRINQQLSPPLGNPPNFPARGAIGGVPAPPAATHPGAPTPLALPVYHILPRNAGSTLAGAPLPIQTSYGYIEFLTYLPEAIVAGNQAGGAVTVPLNLANPAAWDYVTEDPATPNGLFALRDFYRIFGWYAALGIILNFGDQHRENMIVRNRQPCLIDLEICFKHRANELPATMLEYHFGNLNPAEDKNVLLCREGGQAKYTMGRQAGAYILLGFNEALAWIAVNHAVISGWLAGMGNVVARYTPRATADFTNRVWTLYNVMIADQVPAAPIDYNRPPFRNWLAEDIYNWYRFNGRTYKGRPVFSLNAAANDWACYINTDAPAYYRRLNSLDLLNARGVAVNVASPGGLAGVGYLPYPNTANTKCSTIIPPGGAVEQLIIETIANVRDGQYVRLELADNNSGIANQALAAAVNPVAPNTDVVITFATDAMGANAPPTLAGLLAFINAAPALAPVIRARLDPPAAVGAAPVAALAQVNLWLDNPGLAFPGGANFFAIDLEGDPGGGGPMTPLQISTDRLTQIQNATEAASNQAWTNVANLGKPMLPVTTLADVIATFRNDITVRSSQWTTAQNIVSPNF